MRSRIHLAQSLSRPAPHPAGKAGRITLYTLAATLILWLTPAWSNPEILLLVSKKQGPYLAFSNAFKQISSRIAAEQKFAIKTLDVPELQDFVRSRTEAQSQQNTLHAVVAVGTYAASVATERFKSTLVLDALIPRAVSERQTEQGRTALSTQELTLYIDQPFPRQLYAIKYALPEIGRIGVLLGPSSSHERERILRAARDVGLAVEFVEVNTRAELYPALTLLLRNTDGILAVPDRLIYNKSTAQNILLTTYHHGKPLIGYSKAYVDAGAILAVYTTPEQFGRQAAEIVMRAQNTTSGALPEMYFPKYFKVAVNYHVAQSLDISMRSANDIERALLDKETSRYE